MPSPLLCCNVMFGEISSIERGSRCRYEVLVLVLLYNIHMKCEFGRGCVTRISYESESILLDVSCEQRARNTSCKG